MAKDVRTVVGELFIRERPDKTTGEIQFAGDGVFRTLQFQLDIRLDPLERSASAPPPTEDTPTHRVCHSPRGGSPVDLGVAWQREITRGDYIGRPMFSIALNHPDMPDWAANLAAFPRDKAGKYSIEHQRRRAAPIEPGGGDDKRDDDIPY